MLKKKIKIKLNIECYMSNKKNQNHAEISLKDVTTKRWKSSSFATKREEISFFCQDKCFDLSLVTQSLKRKL